MIKKKSDKTERGVDWISDLFLQGESVGPPFCFLILLNGKKGVSAYLTSFLTYSVWGYRKSSFLLFFFFFLFFTDFDLIWPDYDLFWLFFLVQDDLFLSLSYLKYVLVHFIWRISNSRNALPWQRGVSQFLRLSAKEEKGG